MGTYRLDPELRAHDYPLYRKVDTKGDANYLFRITNGQWGLTSKWEHIAKNEAPVASIRAAELPTEENLSWQHFDSVGPDGEYGGNVVEDPSLTVTGVK